MSVDVNAIAAQFGIPTGDSQVQSAVGTVLADAQSDGASDLEATARLQTLFSSYQQIYQHGNIDAGAALNAAKQFVSQNHAVSGAIDTVQGLVSAAQSVASGGATPPQVAAAFSGPVVSLLVGAGALSAGVGAAIVAGIGLVGSLLDAAGVFPNKPGFDVCPGFKLTTPTPPDFAIGCVAVFDPFGTIVPGSKQWRSFPEKAKASDAWWFAMPNAQSSATSWDGATWIVEVGALTLAEPVVSAFAEAYMVLGPNLDGILAPFDPDVLDRTGILSKTAPPELMNAYAGFTVAFRQAWKANKEQWLNGRRGGENWQVLQHLVQLWNRSHEPGAGLDVAYPGDGMIVNLAGGGAFSYVPYWTTLIKALGRQDAGDSQVLTPDGKVHLNTGALKAKKRTIVLNLNGISRLGSFAASPTPSTRAGSAIVATGVVAALGAGAWALVTHFAGSAAFAGAAHLLRRRKKL